MDNKSNTGSDLAVDSVSTGYPRYKVTADHPIDNLPEITGMLFSDALKYADELNEAGYENITIEEITLDNTKSRQRR